MLLTLRLVLLLPALAVFVLVACGVTGFGMDEVEEVAAGLALFVGSSIVP